MWAAGLPLFYEVADLVLRLAFAARTGNRDRQDTTQFAPLHYAPPIPIRAIGDKRLSGRHLRVLAAIASHDRLGKNGQGCWAGLKRLAKESACSETHTSETISDLRLYGYVKSERHQLNNRIKIHRVIYDDDTSHKREVSEHNITSQIQEVSEQGNTSRPKIVSL